MARNKLILPSSADFMKSVYSNPLTTRVPGAYSSPGGTMSTGIDPASIGSGGGGGGGATPAWVSARAAPSSDLPTALFDFKNGLYWGGGATATATDALPTNTAWNTWMPGWDPANLVAGQGIKLTAPNGSNFAVNPAYNPPGLGTIGFTVVIELANPLSIPDNEWANIEIHAINAPWDDDYYVSMRPNYNGNGLNTGWIGGKWDSADNTAPDLPSTNPARLAANFNYSGNIVISLQGAATFPSSAGGPPTAGEPISQIGATAKYTTSTNPIYLQSLAIYALQPDVDLPTLST